ncbi:MAG: Stp1/IreP family PP2C-type Ser/Thr phosphatase [Chloroflexi bacterium]|nr:MAG: Stp1/IreP family PP2C-type Ser/Thr phosphatase [Chloroflexota bacterium]
MKHQHANKNSPDNSAVLLSAGVGAALWWPAQIPTENLFIWLLIAVIGGILMIFVLITFILLPLARRSRKKPRSAARPPVTTETAPTGPEPEQPADPNATVQVQPDDTVIEEASPTEPVITVARPQTLPISGARPEGIGWQIAGVSDVGLRRELNEDSLLMLETESDELGPHGLYVVADGLGGHEAGEIASKLTVDTLKSQFDEQPPAAADVPFEKWFHAAVNRANTAVLEYQGGHKEADKMGSTLVMALLAGENAHICNVGDSRAYHLTAQEIRQISVDHSLVERLVQIGQITREEARVHKQRNVVYSIIGDKRRLEIGTYHIYLAPGDRLLLCSDGLSGMVPDEALLQISQSEPDPADACRQMVQAAKLAGGHDNITAIVIQMNGR